MYDTVYSKCIPSNMSGLTNNQWLCRIPNETMLSCLCCKYKAKQKQLLFAGVSFIQAVKVMATAYVCMYVAFNNLSTLLLTTLFLRPKETFHPINISQAEHMQLGSGPVRPIVSLSPDELKCEKLIFFPLLLHSISLMFWWCPEQGWVGEAGGNSPAAIILCRAAAHSKSPPPFLLDFMVPSGQVCSPWGSLFI